MAKIYTDEQISEQRRLDAEKREELWAALAEEAGGGERGEGIKEAFKQLYTLYKPALAEWFAGLYDGDVGGFYSTEEGRDYESFAPDLECTAQTLAFIEQCGMLREIGTVGDALSDEIKAKMVRFAKSSQNENGFFYHKHWNFDDVNYSLSRRGRDLGWAVQILRRFGASPTYDTPNGIMGDGIDADGNPVTVKTNATPNSQSNSGGKEDKCRADEQKSGEQKAAAKNYPEYLENRETFEEYLKTFDLKHASYHYGNQLNATIGQINARAAALLAEGADYDLREILLEFLNSNLCEKTGYWEDEVKMAGSNGFFKILPLYNGWGKTFPMAERATESVLESIMGEEIAETNCCSIFNLWSCISAIKTNVKKTASEEACEKLLGLIDEVLRKRGAEAILNTYRKMLPYRSDVAFNHSYPGYNCGGTQQGLYTGFPPLLGGGHGNVDATCICSTGLTRTMFQSFGFTRVPLLMKADYMVFTNMLNSDEEKPKKKAQEPYRSLEKKENARFISVFGGADGEWKSGAYEVTLNDGICGANIEKTARICKGDYYVIEAGISLSDIKNNGTLRFSVGRGLDPIKISSFVDLVLKDGKMIAKSDEWERGFRCDIGDIPEDITLRMEYYLDEAPQKTRPERKSSAARIYLNGKLLGTSVNDEGSYANYMSGLTPNVLGGAVLYSPDGLICKIKIKSICHSHESTLNR